MKSFGTSAIALAIALALAGGAYAQARHDEKPHGNAKPAPSATADTPAADRTPGRHDERPHGPAKKTRKADAKKDSKKTQDKKEN